MNVKPNSRAHGNVRGILEQDAGGLASAARRSATCFSASMLRGCS